MASCAIDAREFVLADIPGLIEGAHEGAGLGDRFLGHVERCSVLLHLVDGTAEDPVADYRTVRQELAAYGGGLGEKPEVVAISKADAVPSETLDKLKRALKRAAGTAPLVVSAVAGTGVDTVLRALAGEIAAAKAPRRRGAGRARGTLAAVAAPPIIAV